MKKIGILLLIVCCLLHPLPTSVVATELDNTTDTMQPSEEFNAQDNLAVVSGSYSLDALNPLLGAEKLVNNVRSAIVYEANSQTLMHAWNPDTPMYPASLVKIMTALLAIKNGAPEDVVTVTQAAISTIPYDAVSAKLVADEKLSLEDLLYCLLLGSANDAATVIAEHISGSQTAFVDEMNRCALEIGCTATQFTNAHGLHDENQHTTARDTAKILDVALRNPVFKTIFTAKEYTVGATNLSPERKLTSGNSLVDSASKLYYDARVIGGRTGVAQDGRRCLATAAESNGMSVICVVMGAESVYQDDGYSAISIGGYKETTLLYNACFEGYKTSQILRAEQILRQIPINGAENDLLIAPQDSVITILPLDITAAELTLHYFDRDMTLPIKKGQHVSDVQVWHGSKCVAQTQLFAMNTLYPLGYDQTTEQTSTNPTIPIAVWIILGIVLGAVIVYFSIRFPNRIRLVFTRLRTTRYRKSRKRIR